MYYRPSNGADGRVSTNRKMCFVVQNHLGKGARCAPPLHPPGLWLLQGIEPVAEPVERIAVPSLAEDFALPAPIDLAGVPAPKTPDHFMETTSSRPGKGAFALPFPWTHPIDQEPSCPLEP